MKAKFDYSIIIVLLSCLNFLFISEIHTSTNLETDSLKSPSEDIFYIFAEIESPQVSFKGDLSFSLVDEWFDGEIQINGENITLLNTLVSTPDYKITTSGPLNCLINFSKDRSIPTTIDLVASDLKINQYQFSNLHLASNLREILTPTGGGITLTIDKISQNENFIEKFSFSTTVDRTSTHWPFALSMNGDWEEIFSLTTKGYWHLNENAYLVELNAFEGNISSIPFSLTSQPVLKIIPEITSLSPFILAIGEGTISTSFDIAEEKIKGNLQIDKIPLSILHLKSSPLKDLPLEGFLYGKGTIEGSLNSPHIDFNVQTNDLKTKNKQFATLPPFSASFDFTVRENIANTKGSFTSSQFPSLDFNASFPLIFSFKPLRFEIENTAPIKGQFLTEGEITPLLQLFLTDISVFSGTMKASYAIDGTFNLPQITGTGHLDNVSITILDTGTVLRNLNATIEGTGLYLKLTSITANDGSQGKVEGSGYYHIDPENNNPFSVDLKLSSARLLVQDYLKAMGSGQVNFAGNSKGGNLTGTIEAEKILVTIPKHSPAMMNYVDVTYVNHEDNAPLPQSLSLPPPPWPVNFDVTINVPTTLSVEGDDLTSDWKGEIKVQGNGQTPLLFGDIQLVKGQYMFSGKPFALSQGSVNFAGELGKKTTLYVIATKDLNEIKIDVILRGLIKNPSVSFRSNPPLPQREILSWLLFDRGTSEISQFQGAQLSETITDLSNDNEGPDVLTKIKSSLGIDRFEIGSADDGSAENVNFKVGKYISDNIFISFNKSDINCLAIEAALTERIKLEAQVGDNSEGQFLLRWKKDY